MTACREPFADHDENTCINTGQSFWHFDVVDAAIGTAVKGRLIFPGNAEKVQGVDIPGAYSVKSLFDFFGNIFDGVTHLRIGRDDNVVFARALYRVLERVLMDRKIDHVFSPCFVMMMCWCWREVIDCPHPSHYSIHIKR